MAAQYRARARLKGWASCWAKANAALLLATAWSGYPRSQRAHPSAIAATHPRVVPAVERGMGAVPLRLIEPQPLFLVRPGGGQLAAREQAGPQGVVGLKQEVRVVKALSQAEELLSQGKHRLIFAARVIHHPESPQHAEELRWLPHQLT